MNEKITQLNYKEALISHEAEINAFLDKGTANQELQELLLKRIDIINEIRSGFLCAGIGLESVYVIEQVPEGSLIASGAYDRNNDTLGLAEIENILTTVQNPQKEIKDQVASVLKHELKHQQSLKNAKKKGQAGLIAKELGAEKETYLQELMASDKTTEGKDAYDQTRSKAENVASNLGFTRKQIIELLLNGDEKTIVEAHKEKLAA